MSDLYQSFLYGTLSQTLSYGIYITTLAHCLRWLLLDDEGWNLRQRINWFMLTISIVLFLLLTTDLSLKLKFLIDFNGVYPIRYQDTFVRWIRMITYYFDSPNSFYPIDFIGKWNLDDCWWCSGTFIPITTLENIYLIFADIPSLDRPSQIMACLISTHRAMAL